MKHSKLYTKLNENLGYILLVILASVFVFYVDKVDTEFSQAHPIKYKVVAKLGPIVVDRGLTEIQRDMVVKYGMQIQYIETGKLATQWTEDKAMYDAVPLNTTLTVSQLTKRAYEMAGYTNLPWVMDNFLIFTLIVTAAGVLIYLMLKWLVQKVEAAVWNG